MKLTIHYYWPQRDWRSEPYCFSNPTGEFAGVDEARSLGRASSERPAMGAGSFAICDHLGAELERWKLLPDGGWIKEIAGRRFELVLEGLREVYVVAIDDNSDARAKLSATLQSVDRWQHGAKLIPKGHVRDAELTALGVKAGEVKRISQVMERT